MNSSKVLRSRLFAAMGLGALSAGSVLGCSGETSSPQPGDGSGGATSGDAAVGAGGGSGASGASGAANGGGGNGGNGVGGSSGAIASGGTQTTGGSAGATPTGGAGGHFCEPWPGCATVRRPFLVGASMRSSAVAERDDWITSVAPAPVLDTRTEAFLAQVWLKDALEEHASVAAFARFTLLLLSVGAPPGLIAESQRASLDEIQHARACFALARRYGKTDVGPAQLEVADSIGTLSLADIAALTVAEGCVGETLGALMAAEQVELATDPDVKRVLGKIARDEARHAELAWKFLAWALRTGGKPVEAAARIAFQRTIDDLERMPVVDYGVDIATWHAHGRMTCAEARELSRNGIAHVVLPCLDALLDSGATRSTSSTHEHVAS
jgi:hypothetical protein